MASPLRSPFHRSLIAAAACIHVLLAHGQEHKPPMPAPRSVQPYETGDALRSHPFLTSLGGTVRNELITTLWASKVSRITARNPGLPEVNAIKDAKLAGKLASRRTDVPSTAGDPKTVTPQIGVEFEANWSTQQTPPDNSMAISNGGWIVSTNNDGIVYAQDNGNIAFGAAWSDFFSGQSGLDANIYDPKILYDSQADRFFMVVLHGSTASNSRLLLCFSQTNNPNNGWNIYQLNGNVLNNDCWFDYPSIGVSNNEVYLSGNLFTSGNNQFNQAVLIQIQKNTGYSGGSLGWQYWYGLQSDIGAFTVVPASWGQSGNYGPGILLTSSASGGDNRYVVWDLTDDMGGNPSLNAYTVNVDPYSPAADAQMPGNSDLLDNGDCRILGSFYLNGLLHAVHHGDVGNGWNGILYTRIDISNLSASQAAFGNPGVIDVSYPQMASYASDINDPSVMIICLRSSTSVNPEVRVVNCDANMDWSNSVLVKEGETYVDFIQGEDRWGDYSGMARKHNAPQPEVWLAGCYGSNVSGQLNNTWKTWIAEVGGGPTGVEDLSGPSNTSVYPSPALDMFTLAYTVTDRAKHTIMLHDTQGRAVKQLFQETQNPGEYRLSFNRGQLAAGQYTLTIRTPEKIIAHENLVVQ